MKRHPGWRTASSAVALIFALSMGPLARAEAPGKSGPATAAKPVPVQIEQKPDDSDSLAPRVVATKLCPVQPDPRDGAFEIGAYYGAMFPNGLVGADKTLPTMGLVVGAPVWNHTLQAQVNYASAPAVRVLILELNMRWTFESPYLASYFLTGAHYLSQSSDKATTADRGALGLTTGLGLSFALGKQMEAHFDLRGYVQDRTTILVGGGFSLLL